VNFSKTERDALELVLSYNFVRHHYVTSTSPQVFFNFRGKSVRHQRHHLFF